MLGVTGGDVQDAALGSSVAAVKVREGARMVWCDVELTMSVRCFITRVKAAVLVAANVRRQAGHCCGAGA